MRPLSAWATAIEVLIALALAPLSIALLGLPYDLVGMHEIARRTQLADRFGDGPQAIAHARRKFTDVLDKTPSLVAAEAVVRIAELFAIERELNHPINRIDQLLPWRWQATRDSALAA